MEIPETFQQDLEIDFQGRLRIRFSGKQHAYVVEQRVGRNILPTLPRQMYDDERRQSLAEGYLPIMTVSVSEKMRCPEDGYWLDVPNRETKQITCLACKLKGRTTKVTAGFYPLNSSLLNHLKAIDPLRNMDRDLAKEMLEANEKLTEIQQKELYNQADAYASDNLNRLMGIPVSSLSASKIFEGTNVRGITDTKV